MATPNSFFENPRLPWFLSRRIDFIRNELEELVRTFIMALPGETGSKLRTHILPFKHIGKNVRLMRDTWIEYPENLTIGDNTRINRNCLINAAGGVDIGNNVLIGPSVTIYSLNHNYSDRQLLISDQNYSKARIIIENDVWLGLKSVILPGVTIGEGTVVAAGAIVSRSTDPYSVVAGNPAVQIGQRS